MGFIFHALCDVGMTVGWYGNMRRTIAPQGVLDLLPIARTSPLKH